MTDAFSTWYLENETKRMANKVEAGEIKREKDLLKMVSLPPQITQRRWMDGKRSWNGQEHC